MLNFSNNKNLMTDNKVRRYLFGAREASIEQGKLKNLPDFEVKRIIKSCLIIAYHVRKAICLSSRCLERANTI